MSLSDRFRVFFLLHTFWQRFSGCFVVEDLRGDIDINRVQGYREIPKLLAAMVKESVDRKKVAA